MIRKIFFLLLIGSPLLGASVTITSPVSGQLLMSVSPFNFTATVSGAPTGYSLEWYVDNHRWTVSHSKPLNPPTGEVRDLYTAPWAATWYPGLNGDGPHFVTATLRDIFGVLLASTSAVNFVVNVEGMSNQSFNALPNQSGNTISGTGKWGVITFDGKNAINGGTYLVDGFPLGSSCGVVFATSQNGGSQIPNFNTTCFPNGTREMTAAYSLTNINDPEIINEVFYSSDVAGNAITLPNHKAVNAGLITFTSSGTLPSPLVPGSQWYWSGNASGYGNTVSLAIAGGVMTFTCSSNCGVIAGTPVYIRNVPSTGSNGIANCDGYYLASGGSGTSFTLSAPATCPNGITAGSDIEVDVNPYFVQYVDSNTITVSATPGGNTLTLNDGGSSTHTATVRIRSPYWGGSSDQAATGGPAYVKQLVNFSNGNSPMELRPPFWELHMISGGSTVSVCPKIENTDLSSSTISCNASGLNYQEVDDGGQSGVCSVDTSGNVTPISAGNCQIKVGCTACAAGGVSLSTVTVYAQVHSGSVTFPHFTHNGTIATSYTPGLSFFPLSAWQLGISGATGHNICGNGATFACRPLWLGPMMQDSNVNSSIISPDDPGTLLGNPGGTSCPSWPSSAHTYETAFSTQYNTYFEADTEETHWGNFGQGYLAAFLNNTGFDRQTCYKGWMNNLVSEGRTWKTVGYDELNNYMAGSYPFRNPNLGSTDFPSITVVGGTATYHVAETFEGNWSQSAGTGSWIKMAGAVSNPCLNGWFPVISFSTVSFQTPTTCANGTYTESSAQLYHYYVNISVFGENASYLPRLVPNGAAGTNNVQNWDSTFFTQIVVSNGVAELFMSSHSIVNGQAIRIHASSNNLNVVSTVTVIDTNHFNITYTSSTIETIPANGTYNSSTDPSLYVTVDGNMPPTPFLSLRNVMTSVSNHPATTWGMIGNSYLSVAQPQAVINWQGNTIGEDATFNYIPGSPAEIYGDDTSTYEMATISQATSGLATRGFQLQPRSMLWFAGFDGSRYSKTFGFNPVTDHPKQLYWRSENTVAQIMGMLALNISGLRLYNFLGDTTDTYTNACCGWQGNSPTYVAINPYVTPRQWATMARTNNLIKRIEKYHLQPPMNKPYYGPLVLTDAHTSNYGNELMILCAGETPYSQTVNLSSITIQNGTMYKASLTGYRLTFTPLASGTTSDIVCGGIIPGETDIYIAQSTGTLNDLDNMKFTPPASLPFGASKYLVQVGYYPKYMQEDPVTDCSSGCSIPVNHYNADAWYRIIYADTNSLPISIGDVQKIPAVSK